jgi:hypothetical protein
MKTFEQLQHDWGESKCGRSVERFIYDYFTKEMRRVQLRRADQDDEDRGTNSEYTDPELGRESGWSV